MKQLNEQLRNRRCKRCGHPSDWHRFDDAQPWGVTDPRGKFRCIGYDCEIGGPPPPTDRACNCQDFVEAA